MKLGLILTGIALVFVLAAVGLWRTVGGLVEQAGARSEQVVALDVTFALVDRVTRAPIADAPVRLVFGASPEQQPNDAGQTFTTDAQGIHVFTTQATIDKVQRKRPTNFIGSLMASPELTDHICLGAELGYMTYRWLYVIDLFRFADGDVLSDGLSLYTRDEQGRFSRKGEQDKSGVWMIADLGAMRLTTPGNDLTAFGFEKLGPRGTSSEPRAPSNEHWSVSLTFARDAPPIMR